jgi:hypothetical protein
LSEISGAKVRWKNGITKWGDFEELKIKNWMDPVMEFYDAG